MKNLGKSILIGALALLITTGFVQAQTTAELNDFPGFRARLKEILTEDQLGMLKENRLTMQQFREEFRASLTEEQLAIMQNPELSRKEKQEMLRETLTEEQVLMLKSNRETARSLRTAFRDTLSEEQEGLLQRFFRWLRRK